MLPQLQQTVRGGRWTPRLFSRDRLGPDSPLCRISLLGQSLKLQTSLYISVDWLDTGLVQSGGPRRGLAVV